jgi:hypothetical protein
MFVKFNKERVAVMLATQKEGCLREQQALLGSPFKFE